ncbi:MAG: hypothetical protein ACRCU2_06725, partial [Planktothrix sp.]
CLTLLGCAPEQHIKDCDLPGTGIETQAPLSNPITPVIQIDGTPSMQGFVNLSNSRYIRTLRLIDTAVTTAFGNSLPPQYYRFGMTRRRLPDEKTSLIAQRPWFYDGSNEELLDAQLDVAIKPLDGNSRDQLSIIVADLYQKDHEKSLVLASLQENYLNKGLAVGIVSVKSEFDGMVYDIGLANDSLEYRTTPNNPKTFQPFYVLVLGTYENVVNFFDRLKASSQSEGLNLTDENFVIFYSRLVSSPLHLNINPNDPGSNLPGIRRVFMVNNQQVMVSVSDRQKTEILMLTDENSQETNIPYQVPYQSLSYLLPLADAEIQVSTLYNSDSKTWLNIEQNNLELKNWNFQGEELFFEANFKAQNMQQGVYWLEVDVLPNKLKQPDWWEEWNLKENQVFQGGTTYNLLPFLTELKALNLNQIKTQGIGRFCYLVHKNF